MKRFSDTTLVARCRSQGFGHPRRLPDKKPDTTNADRDRNQDRADQWRDAHNLNQRRGIGLDQPGTRLIEDRGERVESDNPPKRLVHNFEHLEDRRRVEQRPERDRPYMLQVTHPHVRH